MSNPCPRICICRRAFIRCAGRPYALSALLLILSLARSFALSFAHSLARSSSASCHADGAQLLAKYCAELCAAPELSQSELVTSFFWPSDGSGSVVAPDGSMANLMGDAEHDGISFREE